MKRISLAVMAGGTAAVLALGVAAATAVPVGFSQDRSADLAKQINPAKPKSVILLIGDGTDDSMITAARNYSVGAAGRLALDELPFTGAMTTYGLQVGAGPDYPIAYVSDSAPTATAWSTGKKSVDGRLSQGPSAGDTIPGEDYETVLEKFKKAGKLTGNVATSEITDATPAAAAAHINQRACQGPANMATCPTARKSVGGKGSIAEQLVDSKIDVILGGGLNRYSQTLEDGSETVLSYAKTKKGYRSVANAAELDAITSLTGGPVLGLFSGGNMTRKYAPLLAVAGGAGSASTKCVPQDRGAQPTLAAMTTKALALLDNPAGFFLQVEGSNIDKGEHERDICGAIGELEEFDIAVKVAMDYQKTHPDTLVIVTGDHANSTQIVPSDFGGSRTATVQTFDGDPMTVAYSSSYDASGSTATHTGAQIRVAAVGPQAANVTGTIDQTDLFATMLGRTPSTLPGTPPVTVTASPTAQPTVTVTASPTAQPTVTATPGAPSTTAPGQTRPIVKIAAAKKIPRAAGTSVAVAVLDAGSVKVVVRQGDKKLVSDKLSATGGSIILPALAKGAVKIVVIANGEGGTTRTNRTLQVR